MMVVVGYLMLRLIRYCVGSWILDGIEIGEWIDGVFV